MNESLISSSFEDSEYDFFAPKPEPIPFDNELFAPLSFKPANEVEFAVKRARKLLKNRTNEQCVAIARTISRMFFVIESLEREGAMFTVEPSKPKNVLNSQGRALFQWMDTFDITGITCAKTEWFEVFAVQVLILCIEYTRDSLDNQTESWNGKAAAIIDSLARAEVLEKHGRVHTSAQSLGRKGGKGRSLKQEPLEKEVIRLYLDGHQHMPVLKAANCIALIIEGSKPELLLLTKNNDKPVAIQNIIRKVKAGRSKVLP